MKKFDTEYRLLDDMYQDGYFPDDLVDKVKECIRQAIAFLETVARDSIGETVGYILEWFDLALGAEEAIRERDW